MVRNYTNTLLLILIIVCSESCQHEKTHREHAVRSLLGKTYYPAPASDKMIANLEEAKSNFNNDPENLENIIWYGRRIAYLGHFQKAIDIYTDGITKFPNEPRLYRHRGHRYISIREFDKAIADLEKAAGLVKGTANQVEQDGLPDAQNIPVSTLHGNIYYHLGLAYYLKHDYRMANVHFKTCLAISTNDDNRVSSTHWLYMIQRRLGNHDFAPFVLDYIHENMKIIENFSYYNLCKVYKGYIPIDSLPGIEDNPSGASIAYGKANWEFYNGRTQNAEKMFEALLEIDSWSSFGFIAAESDIQHYFTN